MNIGEKNRKPVAVLFYPSDMGCKSTAISITHDYRLIVNLVILYNSCIMVSNLLYKRSHFCGIVRNCIINKWNKKETRGSEIIFKFIISNIFH